MPISYFIPDWDDRVDPNYDFLADKHTPRRNPYHDDRYAHEIYAPNPLYDGVLLSRAVIDDAGKKLEHLISLQSVHFSMTAFISLACWACRACILSMRSGVDNLASSEKSGRFAIRSAGTLMAAAKVVQEPA